MTPDEYREYKKVTTTLVSMSKGASVVKNNVAQKIG